MTRFPGGQTTLPALALVLSMLLLVPPMVAAQEADRPCAEDVAPADDFQSTGIGLTNEELEALYGEGEIGQGSIIYDFQGIDLHKVDCDLILTFPQDGSVAEVEEIALAESLLPADAELVGTIALGTTIAEFEANTLWRRIGSRAWTRIAVGRSRSSTRTSRWGRQSNALSSGRWSGPNIPFSRGD